MNERSTSPSRPLTSWARVAVLGIVAMGLVAGASGVRTTLSASSQPGTASLAAPMAAAVPPQFAAAPQSYSTVVDKVAPAVVTIRVQKQAEMTPTAMSEPFREFFGGRRGAPDRHREAGLGSGVIVGDDGFILTNQHVVAGADTIRVDTADGRSFPATLVGSDSASDLAVVRIAARGLPVLRYGDSDRMKVGDVVLAFGNPLGVGQTVTMGIVSAKGRATGISDGSYEDFLQTDAPINQGNSGGALVNLQGELVGINAQIVSPSGGNIGLGFAIPSSMAQAVAEQLTRDGVVHRAKLGVTVQGLTPELAESLGVTDAHGALVSEVESGGPADRAGVKQGDVVVQVDGRAVSTANAMRNQIASTRPGSSVPIVVRRNGATQTLTAKLAEREPVTADDAHPAAANRTEPGFGLTLEPLTPRLAEQLELPRTTSGLVVTDIDPAGLAATAGLKAGDVIKAVNGQSVASVSALRAALKSNPDRPALVLVSRSGADAFVALPRANS